MFGFLEHRFRDLLYFFCRREWTMSISIIVRTNIWRAMYVQDWRRGEERRKKKKRSWLLYTGILFLPSFKWAFFHRRLSSLTWVGLLFWVCVCVCGGFTTSSSRQPTWACMHPSMFASLNTSSSLLEPGEGRKEERLLPLSFWLLLLDPCCRNLLFFKACGQPRRSASRTR